MTEQKRDATADLEQEIGRLRAENQALRDGIDHDVPQPDNPDEIMQAWRRRGAMLKTQRSMISSLLDLDVKHAEQIADLKAEVNRLKQTIATMEDLAEGQSREIELLTAEKAELRQMLRSAFRDVERLQQTIANMEEDL